jgi:gluconolactonase
LWGPAGRFYFADVRDDKLYRVVPGSAPEFVRETRNGNGTCFDLQGRIVQCEGLTRRVTRWNPLDGSVETLADRAEGKRLNRPNDVICRSNGDLMFSDPAFRVPVAERELDAAVWRIAPDGAVSLVANCEYPRYPGKRILTARSSRAAAVTESPGDRNRYNSRIGKARPTF